MHLGPPVMDAAFFVTHSRRRRWVNAFGGPGTLRHNPHSLWVWPIDGHVHHMVPGRWRARVPCRYLHPHNRVEERGHWARSLRSSPNGKCEHVWVILCASHSHNSTQKQRFVLIFDSLPDHLHFADPWQGIDRDGCCFRGISYFVACRRVHDQRDGGIAWIVSVSDHSPKGLWVRQIAQSDPLYRMSLGQSGTCLVTDPTSGHAVVGRYRLLSAWTKGSITRFEHSTVPWGRSSGTQSNTTTTQSRHC